MERPFHRSRPDAVIFGVCGGLARYLNWDPTLVRLLFVLGAIYCLDEGRDKHGF
ncbi:MAG: PspC domain-containing protein [Dehalococcoidia bacterium]|nr:PspC domain-containing protein [Dehalococcoidia bacterium]